jgi:mRNA interferase RelE/StbE
MKCTVRISMEALEQLKNVKDRSLRQELFDRIEKLANDPEQQGKPLRNELAGLRSVKAVRQRYRIVYQVEREEVVVVVVAVRLRKEGDRSDIYRQAALLVKYTRPGSNVSMSKNNTIRLNLVDRGYRRLIGDGLDQVGPYIFHTQISEVQSPPG